MVSRYLNTLWCLSITHSFVSRSLFFFFNDTATTEIYTLSLHDALPICVEVVLQLFRQFLAGGLVLRIPLMTKAQATREKRSEEHTSELQSPDHIVCRLLLEKKKPRFERTHNSPHTCRSFVV